MQKKIYLTIDDSPSSSFRENVDYLIERDIPAVFFCIGNLMDDHWEDIIYAIQHGYQIGNHSYSHPHFSDLELEVAKKEIAKTDAKIERAYKEAGVTDYDRLFRFPYGDKGDGKYGMQFTDFKTANQSRQSRLDKWVKKINRLHPLNRHIDGMQEELGREKAEKLQQYLFQLGYVRGDLTGVNYDFFHPLKTDQDWSWTFDIAEWQWNERSSQEAFLNNIFQRLESDDPKDFRGAYEEKTGIQQIDKTDIVLFHDRDVTNLFFKPIIDRLVSMEVRFLPVDYNQIKQK